MKKKKVKQRQLWIEKAVKTFNFHAEKLRANPEWRLEHTAKSLNKSLGAVCQDIMIATWYKTHKDDIEEFQYAKDALEFIREQKKRRITDVHIS